ncbi:MAG: carboxy terminal-processing peptidase [Roseivirga sp.]|nr:carboxy terminal-processing peptidase [Roseivirga sp.]
MRQMRNVLMIPFLLAISVVQVFAERDTTEFLQPKSEHLKEARLVVQILDYFHYRNTDLEDSLSSVIFDNFLSSLDANKNYFLATDIRSFQKYRFSLDEDLKAGNLVPAYYIFNIYKKRVEARLAYALERSGDKFDFSKDEFYRFDRENAAYAKTSDELDDLWYKQLKHQALNLKLSGSEDEKIAEVLKGRYERFLDNVSKYNSNDVFEMFMNSVTEAFDPHTNYFTPLNAEDFRRESSKSMEGIGATLQQDKDYTKIIELRPGGPAFLSGQITKDDRVVGVAQGAEGEMIDVIGWRSDEVAGKIRGAKGTLVRLKILPAGATAGGETKVVNIVRDKIKYDEARAQSKVIEYEENGDKFTLGVITVPDFYLDADGLDAGDKNYVSTTNDVKKLIKEFEEQGVDGVMLDLRNNGGGALFEAINLSGLFLPGGPVVQVKYANGNIEKGNDDDKTMFYDGPLNVMINRFSASASEIFAGAIQDYKRGVVVGEQTYGKGTVQNVRGLNDFMREPTQDKLGLLKYTIAKFYRVTGSSTQHLGVTPDIQFPSAYGGSEFGESSQPSALPWDKIASAQFKPLNFVDNQLISILNKRHAGRLKTDQSLLDYQYDISVLKDARKLQEVSLNYDKRKKEQEDREQQRASRVKVGDSLSELEASKVKDRSLDDLKDPYLKESIILLAEQIAAKKKRG